MAFIETMGFIKTETVIEQGLVFVGAAALAIRSHDHRNQAHVLAYRRGHQTIARSFGMAGFYAIDRVVAPE
jgi:hypothetical protein